MSDGRFIVFEGIDGSGKGTQVEILEERLQREGYVVSCYEFPQYDKTIFGKFLRSLLDGEHGDVANFPAYLMSLPYAAGRWKASPLIRADLEAGKIVLADRYASSNMGHQGGKIQDNLELEEYISWLEQIEFSKKGFGIPRPDQINYLDLKPEISRKLMEKRAREKGIELDEVEKNFTYAKNSSRGFLRVAEMKGWNVINCNDYDKEDILPEQEIARQIWEFVEPILPAS